MGAGVRGLGGLRCTAMCRVAGAPGRSARRSMPLFAYCPSRPFSRGARRARRGARAT